MGIDTIFFMIAIKCKDMVKRSVFGNGGTHLHILLVRKPCGYCEAGLIIILDPQNLGLDTLFLQ